jgi:hypothetical protein
MSVADPFLPSTREGIVNTLQRGRIADRRRIAAIIAILIPVRMPQIRVSATAPELHRTQLSEFVC